MKSVTKACRVRRDAAALGVALVLLGGVSEASPVYPDELRDLLMLDCKPPCTICHRTLAGGYTTVVKDFGRAMGAMGGLMGESPDLLPPAVMALEDAMSDVDGDGVPDIDELRTLTDPNVPDANLDCLPEDFVPPPPPPLIDDSESGGGCAVGSGTRRGSFSSWALLALLVLGRSAVGRTTRGAARARRGTSPTA